MPAPDIISLACPVCSKLHTAQSVAQPSRGKRYAAEDAPAGVSSGINGHEFGCCDRHWLVVVTNTIRVVESISDECHCDALPLEQRHIHEDAADYPK